MSGISKYTYTTLTAAIRSYTEVDSNVLTQGIIDNLLCLLSSELIRIVQWTLTEKFKRVP
jgi:hypothetical protein